MSPNIRLGEPKDAEFIAKSQLAMALETESKTLEMDVVLPAVKTIFEDSSKGHYYVAEIDGEVVGCLLITFEWSDWRNSNVWYIQSVFVVTEFRGKGVFKSLYHRVMDDAKENQAMFVRLYVETENERAQKTYESLGMKRLPYYMYQVKLEK